MKARVISILLMAYMTAGIAAPGLAQNETKPVLIGPNDRPEDIIRRAAEVVPSPRQLAWQRVEFAAFIHFGMNTFTDREWGEGKEDPKLFNPTDFDARQWALAVRDAGMKMLILTAKHHDGFCLWPSRTTEHSVKNSPWKGGRGDVVREVADACREAGIKLGIYVSPWDRHEPSYGDSPAYNEHFKRQLHELLTNYGEIADVWFDGACGEGPNGKRQVYDWAGYWRLIRELQPGATISIMGPDVRWCGNEAGLTRTSEWSVIPFDEMDDRPVEKDPGGIAGLKAGAPDLGSREAITAVARKDGRLVWYPAQVDTSIRPGWFYHAAEDGKVKTLGHLIDVYFGSVGGNSQLLLNIPPDRRGRLHDNDVERLREIGRFLKNTFSNNLAAGAKATASAVRGRDPKHAAAAAVDGDIESYWCPDDATTEASLEFELSGPKAFNTAMLQEQIRVGQRIEEFALDIWSGAVWREVARSTTIGYKRLLRFPDVTAAKVRVRILQSRLGPTLSEFGLYFTPAISGRSSGRSS